MSNKRSTVQPAYIQRHYYQELDFWVKHALAEIEDQYGDVCRIKPKSLHKFGQNQSVGTSEVLIANMQQNETYVSTNAIDSISSSSGSDTNTMTVEGHTISGTDLTFVSQTVVLTGQTAATLSTPLARVSRAFTNTNLVGDVYIHESDTLTGGVPQTASKIHMKVLAGSNQSRKAATSFSSQDYFIMTRLIATVGKKTDAFVDLRMKTRQVGNDFRVIRNLSVSRNSPIDFEFKPFVIIPKNSDLILTAAASTTDVDVEAEFHGLFGLVEA